MDSFTAQLAKTAKTWDMPTLEKSLAVARSARPAQQDVVAVLEAEVASR